jgi:hypothetical protein
MRRLLLEIPYSPTNKQKHQNWSVEHKVEASNSIVARYTSSVAGCVQLTTLTQTHSCLRSDVTHLVPVNCDTNTRESFSSYVILGCSKIVFEAWQADKRLLQSDSPTEDPNKVGRSPTRTPPTLVFRRTATHTIAIIYTSCVKLGKRGDTRRLTTAIVQRAAYMGLAVHARRFGTTATGPADLPE